MSVAYKLPVIFIQWIIFLMSFSQIKAHGGHGGADAEAEKFYEDCGISNTCLGLMPEKSKLVTCVSSVCPASLVLMPPFPNEPDQTIHFHLRLNINEYGYMAVGLTTKSKMNQMLVMECLVDAELNAYSFLSWNEDMPNDPSPSSPFTPPVRLVGQVSVLDKIDKEYNTSILPNFLNGINITLPDRQEGNLFCTFRLPKKFKLTLPTSGDRSFNLVKSKYSVAVSVGAVDDNEGSCPNVVSQDAVKLGPSLCKHRAVGSRRFNLLEVQFPVEGEIQIYGQLHAFLMVLAYFLFIPSGTIVSRYFRETWTERHLCKRRIWFPMHFTLLYCALACVWVAYICQAVGHKAIWPDGEHSKDGPTHAWIGMASMILLLIQTILPWVIPSSRVTLRKWHSIFHAVIGTICYGLGVFNILLTPILIPDAGSCGIIFVSFLWIGFHFCIYWLLATLLVIKDHQMVHNDEKFRALLSYPMKLQTKGDAPGKTKRKVFLAVLVISSLCMTGLMAFHIFVDAYDDRICDRYLKVENSTANSLSTTVRSVARW